MCESQLNVAHVKIYQVDAGKCNNHTGHIHHPVSHRIIWQVIIHIVAHISLDCDEKLSKCKAFIHPHVMSLMKVGNLHAFLISKTKLK